MIVETVFFVMFSMKNAGLCPSVRSVKCVRRMEKGVEKRTENSSRTNIYIFIN